MEDVRLALSRLDPKNDEHWTSDGVPRVDAVSTMVGRAVTRKEIVDAAPALTRESAAAAGPEQTHPATGEPRTEVKAPADGSPATIEGDKGAEPRSTGPVTPAQNELRAEPTPLEIAQRRAAALQHESNEIAEEIRDLQKMKAQIDAEHARAVADVERLGPSPDQQERDNIRAYLQRAQKAREDRAARVSGILGDGLKMREVLTAAGGRSALDGAMAMRKPPLGAGRPSPRPPVPAQ